MQNIHEIVHRNEDRINNHSKTANDRLDIKNAIIHPALCTMVSYIVFRLCMK